MANRPGVIESAADLESAIQWAGDNPKARWYVARMARAYKRANLIPRDWDVPEVQSFREQSLTSEEDLAKSAEVDKVIDAFADTVEDLRDGKVDQEQAEALVAAIAGWADQAGVLDEALEALTAGAASYVEEEFISPAEMTALLAAGDTVRRVRTQAGVQRYKAPIGTPIVRNARTGKLEADKSRPGTGKTRNQSGPLHARSNSDIEKGKELGGFGAHVDADSKTVLTSTKNLKPGDEIISRNGQTRVISKVTQKGNDTEVTFTNDKGEEHSYTVPGYARVRRVTGAEERPVKDPAGVKDRLKNDLADVDREIKRLAEIAKAGGRDADRAKRDLAELRERKRESSPTRKDPSEIKREPVKAPPAAEDKEISRGRKSFEVKYTNKEGKEVTGQFWSLAEGARSAFVIPDGQRRPVRVHVGADGKITEGDLPSGGRKMSDKDLMEALLPNRDKDTPLDADDPKENVEEAQKKRREAIERSEKTRKETPEKEKSEGKAPEIPSGKDPYFQDLLRRQADALEAIEEIEGKDSVGAWRQRVKMAQTKLDMGESSIPRDAELVDEAKKEMASARTGLYGAEEIASGKTTRSILDAEAALDAAQKEWDVAKEAGKKYTADDDSVAAAEARLRTATAKRDVARRNLDLMNERYDGGAVADRKFYDSERSKWAQRTQMATEAVAARKEQLDAAQSVGKTVTPEAKQWTEEEIWDVNKLSRAKRAEFFKDYSPEDLESLRTQVNELLAGKLNGRALWQISERKKAWRTLEDIATKRFAEERTEEEKERIANPVDGDGKPLKIFGEDGVGKRVLRAGEHYTDSNGEAKIAKGGEEIYTLSEVDMVYRLGQSGYQQWAVIRRLPDGRVEILGSQENSDKSVRLGEVRRIVDPKELTQGTSSGRWKGESENERRARRGLVLRDGNKKDLETGTEYKVTTGKFEGRTGTIESPTGDDLDQVYVKFADGTGTYVYAGELRRADASAKTEKKQQTKQKDPLLGEVDELPGGALNKQYRDTFVQAQTDYNEKRAKADKFAADDHSAAAEQARVDAAVAERTVISAERALLTNYHMQGYVSQEEFASRRDNLQANYMRSLRDAQQAVTARDSAQVKEAPPEVKTSTIRPRTETQANELDALFRDTDQVETGGVLTPDGGLDVTDKKRALDTIDDGIDAAETNMDPKIMGNYVSAEDKQLYRGRVSALKAMRKRIEALPDREAAPTPKLVEESDKPVSDLVPAVREEKRSVSDLSKHTFAGQQLNEAHVELLARKFRRDGYSGDPVQVEEFANGGYKVTDGHHRLEAAKRAGLSDIPVRVFAATEEGRREAVRALVDRDRQKSGEYDPERELAGIQKDEQNRAAFDQWLVRGRSDTEIKQIAESGDPDMAPLAQEELTKRAASTPRAEPPSVEQEIEQVAADRAADAAGAENALDRALEGRTDAAGAQVTTGATYRLGRGYQEWRVASVNANGTVNLEPASGTSPLGNARNRKGVATNRLLPATEAPTTAPIAATQSTATSADAATLGELKDASGAGLSTEGRYNLGRGYQRWRVESVNPDGTVNLVPTGGGDTTRKRWNVAPEKLKPVAGDTPETTSDTVPAATQEDRRARLEARQAEAPQPVPPVLPSVPEPVADAAPDTAVAAPKGMTQRVYRILIRSQENRIKELNAKIQDGTATTADREDLAKAERELAGLRGEESRFYPPSTPVEEPTPEPEPALVATRITRNTEEWADLDDETLDDLISAYEEEGRSQEEDAVNFRNERAFRDQQNADLDRIIDLIGQGYSQAEAEAEVTGQSVDSIRRRDAVQWLRETYNGVPQVSGNRFEEVLAAAYRFELEQEMIRAEAETNGVFFSKEAQQRMRQRNQDASILWQGNERTARANASEELKAYWDRHGRLTKDAFRERVLQASGGKATGSNYRGSDFLQ